MGSKVAGSSSSTNIIANAIVIHPLFAGCNALQRSKLLAASKLCSYQPGANIIKPNAPAKYYYLILQGQVQIANTGAQLLSDGSSFGQEAFADGSEQQALYMAGAIAIVPTTLIRIERQALLDLVTAKPAIRSQALLELARQLSAMPVVKPPAISKLKSSARLPRKEIIGWLLTMMAPVLVWFLAESSGLPAQASVYLGLFTMTALMWLFALVDEYIPPLVAVIAMLFIDLVPASVALHGFYSRTFILLLGVYALSALMVSSGLAYRFMLCVLRVLPDKPFWHRFALTLFGFLLSITIPSANARMSLMLPLYKEMDASLKLPKQSPEATALMLSTFTGATLFAPLLLTAKSSNLAAFTMLPAQVRREFQGSAWLMCAGFIAIGLLLVHLWAMRKKWLPKTPTPLPLMRIKQQIDLLGALKAPEWVAIVAFLAFLFGTFLPQWHQSQAAWLAGLILASILILGLLNKQSFKAKIDWPMIFFLLALDGLTDAIAYLGLDKLIINNIGVGLQWMDGSLFWFIWLAFAVTVVLRLVLPATAGMVLAATILLPFGTDLGIHPWIVIFLTSLFSDIWFMPHQNSTYQQVMGAGLTARADLKLFMRYNWLLNASRLVLAFASIPYWQWLGLHP